MRWGKQLRRGVKATLTRHDDPRRGGKHSSKYNNRREFDEYSDDDDDYSDSQQFFDVDDMEEDESLISWDPHQRGGDPVEYRDDIRDDGDEDEEYTLDEFREGDDDTNELVTRDQVLDELRAQAAADALGKSLEQMGYNLDNCDSFYSLSETEKEDQRYNISQHNSEVSDHPSATPSKRRLSRKSKKKKKLLKKKPKSSRSRYDSAASDEEDEEDSTTLYGDPTTTLGRHSFGDYETFISTSSDDSDADDSYYEDETSFTTGQVSALTGKTSRFSRFTGKKSAKTRKSLKAKQRKKRLRGGDHETYYSRGTEWTLGEESSYDKTLRANSTLSSVSDSELDSELDGDTMYTELTRKRDRALKKKMNSRVRSKSQPNRRKPTGRMKGIDEDMEYTSPNLKHKQHRHHHHHHHPHHHVHPKHEKKNTRKKITRPCDASVESDSSMIGAMRSLDTLEDDAPPDVVEDDKQQETNKPQEIKDDKKTPVSPKGTKKPKESVLADIEADLLKSKAKNSPKKVRDGEADVPPADVIEPSRKNSRTSKKEHEKEAPNERDDNEQDDADHAEKSEIKGRGKQQSDKKKRRSSKSASVSKDDGSAREQKKSSKHSSKNSADGDDSDDVPNVKDTAKKSKEKGKRQDHKRTGHSDKPPIQPKASKGSKQGSEKKQSTRADEPSNSEAKDSSSTKAETGSIGKKFWPRQFLSLRKKKNDNVQVDADAKVDSEKVEEENKPLDTEEVTESDDNDEPPPEKEKEEGKQRKSRKDKSNSTRHRKSNRERSRERSRSRDARSPSPTRMEKETSSILQEKTKSPESRRKATKERPKDSSALLREIFESKGCGPLRKNDEEEQPVKQGKSLGILDMAAMAAMIPLVPIAAAYSCYTAESTQTMLKNMNTTCTECKTNGAQAYADCKNSDDSPKNTTDEDEKSRSSSKKRRSRKYIDSIFHSDNEDESAKSENESKKSAKSTNSKLAEQKKTITEPDENHIAKPLAKPRDEPSESKSKRSGRSGRTGTTSRSTSRSKRSMAKILPQRSGKYDPPQTHIQEATEGFESFLPPQGQCLPDSTSLAGQALTTIIPGSTDIQNLPSSQKMPKKKKKWTMPKLRLNKKADDKKADTVAPPKDTVVLPPAAENAKTTQGKAAIPFLKPSKKPPPASGDDLANKALSSFWAAEAPTAARNKKKAATKSHKASTDGDLNPFNCSQTPAAVCGKVDLERDVPTDHSLLSDFENLALDALKKKSQKSQKDKEKGTPDPAKATQEDLLNYYDLGQTLSDVIDARQTLEQAYGMHSGGGSFDHTIDEQLVELLAHMAEMDQEDVVEIEAAIKKLKRHARKLGISERDLLFSVKSAEGSALSLADDDFLHRDSADEAEEAPASFGDKMYDAIFWRK